MRRKNGSKTGYTRYLFGSMKGGEMTRVRSGNMKTTKLPTSLEELREIENRMASSTVEHGTLNPVVRGSSPRSSSK